MPVLGFLADTGNTDGLDPHELGHVALLMEDVLKEAMSAIEHIEGVAVGMRGSLRPTHKKNRPTNRPTTLEAVKTDRWSQDESESSQPDEGHES